MVTKTAASLTNKDIGDYRAQLRSRRVTIPERTLLRLERAKKVAAQAASMLKENFQVDRVALFGSIVSPNRFHGRSDIDLAVWGMKERDYYRAVGVLQSIDPEFSIDVIVFDEASPELQKTILVDGVTL